MEEGKREGCSEFDGVAFVSGDKQIKMVVISNNAHSESPGSN